MKENLKKGPHNLIEEASPPLPSRNVPDYDQQTIKIGEEQKVQIFALRKISDVNVLRRVAQEDPSALVRRAAVSRLEDRPLLEHIADTDSEALVRNAAMERKAALVRPQIKTTRYDNTDASPPWRVRIIRSHSAGSLSNFSSKPTAMRKAPSWIKIALWFVFLAVTIPMGLGFLGTLIGQLVRTSPSMSPSTASRVPSMDIKLPEPDTWSTRSIPPSSSKIDMNLELPGKIQNEVHSMKSEGDAAMQEARRAASQAQADAAKAARDAKRMADEARRSAEAAHPNIQPPKPPPVPKITLP